MGGIKVLSDELLGKGRFLELHRSRFIDARGVERSWEMACRARHQNAVGIVAVVRPDDELILIRQYRPAAGQYVIEFPAGLIDPGETPQVTGPRELYEETGYEGKMIGMLPFSFGSVGMCAEAIATVLIEVDGERYRNGAPPQHTEENEDIKVIRVPQKGLLTFLLKAYAGGDAVDSKLLYYAMALESGCGKGGEER